MEFFKMRLLANRKQKLVTILGLKTWKKKSRSFTAVIIGLSPDRLTGLLIVTGLAIRFFPVFVVVPENFYFISLSKSGLKLTMPLICSRLSLLVCYFLPVLSSVKSTELAPFLVRASQGFCETNEHDRSLFQGNQVNGFDLFEGARDSSNVDRNFSQKCWGTMYLLMEDDEKLSRD